MVRNYHLIMQTGNTVKVINHQSKFFNQTGVIQNYNAEARMFVVNLPEEPMGFFKAELMVIQYGDGGYLYLDAPHHLERYANIGLDKTIFLAGSITGASDWQRDAAERLIPYFNVFNPRRNNYTPDESQERIQISWEFKHLELAEITLFYFAPETLAPITLLEYGKQLVKCKYAPFRKTYVCINPDYKRKNDVIIQTELENPIALKRIFFDLEETLQTIITENSK